MADPSHSWSRKSDRVAVDGFLAGGGEMGALIRTMGWPATGLGAPDTWPQNLRTTASLCLASRFPIVIYWGPDLLTIYNDAYAPILAGKHPRRG